MTKSHMFAGAAALAMVVAAAAAVALPRTYAVHRASQSDLAAAQAGQGSLGRAMAAAEDLTGGHVIEIHYVAGEGAGQYEATVSRNGMVDHVLINPANDRVAVIGQGEDSGRTFEFKEKAGSEIVVTGAKVALKDAVASAEQASRGVAVSARTTRSGDGYMVAHDVDTVSNDLVRPVLIDAKTGLVIGNPQAFGSPEP